MPTALFAAVGDTGALTTSPDGTTWTSRTSGFSTFSINAVAWSPALSLFVAVGNSGTLTTSPDGTTWTSRTSGFGAGGTILAVAWSPALSLFVAVGYDATGTNGFLTTSPDGTTWTSRTSGFGASRINAVAWSPALSLFVAVGASGKLFTSSDGTTWTSRTSGFGTTTILGVAWSPVLSLFVAVGGSGTLTTSPDGTTWTSRTSGFGTTAINAVAWSPALSLFVAVGTNGKLFTSPDGTTWTSRTSGFGTDNINAVAWSPALSLFVAVGASGKLFTSPDGTTWTSRTSGFGANIIRGVAWSLVNNVAPNAPTLTSPANNSTFDRAVTQRFAWAISDPDVGDSQSAFSLRYKLVGAGVWTTITGTTPNTFYDFAAGTFAAGNYEWQVATTDALGLIGPYSASSFFTAASAPAMPTITAPVNESTVNNTATLTWSAPTQTNYQFRKVADNAGAADTATIYYDSGDVIDASTRSRSVDFPVNNRWEHVQVRVKASGLWSTWADCRVNVSFTPPAVPTLVLTTNPTLANLTVTITNPNPGGAVPATSYNNVFISSPLDPEIRVATLVPPNSAWTWWLPAAGRVYTVRAVAVAANGTSVSSV